MKLQDKIRAIAQNIAGLHSTVARSRNRHRELDLSFDNCSKALKDISDHIESVLESCDTNMTLFESLIELYERGHITINPDSPGNIKDFAKDLFLNMRSLFATYEEAKEASISDSTAD